MAKPVARIQGFFGELKRRSVFRVASVYVVTAWGASMGAAQMLPAFGAPDWTVRMFVVIAILGLPMAVALAWAYEITPKGIVRDSGSGDAPDNHGPDGNNTTAMFGAQGLVRVSWRDGNGRHEKTFYRDFRIGRDDSCEVHLDDPMISRRHAEISHKDGRWCIRDLASRNGTTVDRRRVTEATLPSHCEVKLYDAGPVLRVEVRAPSSAQTITS